jgi:hypothetical protein
MSENTKGLLSVVTILGCLALIGFLVHEKVDGAAVLAVSALTTIVAWVTRPPTRLDPPSGTTLVAGMITAAWALAGCSYFTPQNVKTALDATELACVFSSELTDSKAVAEACKIDAALVPVLEQLIAQRDAARKQGVKWTASAK